MTRTQRLRYSDLWYYIWVWVAVICTVMAFFTLINEEWPWAFGCGGWALAASAHARLERFDGHRHNGGIEVP